jgi:hypothetical protein
MIRSSAGIGAQALLTPDALKRFGEIRRCSVSVLEVLVKNASEGHGFSYAEQVLANKLSLERRCANSSR